MHWIFRSCGILVFCSLSACALFEERRGPEASYGPRERVYSANFDEVWRAVNIVLQPYPLRISNMDQGILETDTIRGYRIFTPVYKSVNSNSSDTYRISIKVIKGSLESRSATKVNLIKDTQSQSDFFSDPKPVKSDGLEENAILYRIGREVQIERALVRVNQKQNNATKN